jgi:hypothetical protein
MEDIQGSPWTKYRHAHHNEIGVVPTATLIVDRCTSLDMWGKVDMSYREATVVPVRRTKAGLVLVYTDVPIELDPNMRGWSYYAARYMNHKEGNRYRHSVPLLRVLVPHGLG